MDVFRWEWRLANRGVVTAVIDAKEDIEAVSQGARVLSKVPRGTRADGHTVVVEGEKEDEGDAPRPPLEAVVTFDPRLPVCVLRIDGHEVAPSVWPVRERRTLPPPVASRPWGAYVLAAIVIGALVVASALLLSRSKETPAARPDAQLGGIHRSANGLFIAHYPEDLEARLAVLPAAIGGVVLEDKAKTLTVVVAALPLGPSIANDPWAVQQQLRDEALANVPKGSARFEESSRGEGTCLGERGAVVSGALGPASARRARVWSCAFIHGGSAYLVLYAVAEPAGPAAEARARAIVDATELTRLADLGGAPN